MGGRWWKIIGLAGLAGVAATGAVLARNERRRRSYTPDEIRSRLLERHAQAVAATPAQTPSGPAVEPGRGVRRWGIRRRSRPR